MARPAPTPQPLGAAQGRRDTIVGVVNELLQQAPGRIAAVGIGAAGFVAADRATIVFAPHLSWRQEPLRDRLSA